MTDAPAHALLDTERRDVFSGAPQHSSAAAHGAIGASLRARKPGAFAPGDTR
jgi:hypothetical protein